MHLPGLIDSEHSQMVAILVVELRTLLVGKLLLLPGSVEHVLNIQHGDNRRDLFRAAEINRHKHHFGQLRF